jgi:geranylgeranylglycerol-phosphate geranylgeranyltransferase
MWLGRLEYMNKLGGYVHLMRPLNCAMMGFAVLVGAMFVRVTPSDSYWFDIAYGFLTGFTLTAASMAINDYYDRNIDAINEPKRPIPSGAVNPKEALALTFFLTAIGLITAYITSISCLLLAVISWAISVSYTTVGKRSGLPGNFLVAACVSVPFIYGSLAVAGIIELNVLLFASMAFLSVTGREITKGIVDVQGDKAQNVKTMAVRFGEKTAVYTAVMFFLLAVSLSPIPLLLDLVSFWFIPLVVATDIGLIASSLMLLSNYSRENARKVKNMVLLWFLLGLLAFILGALTRTNI